MYNKSEIVLQMFSERFRSRKKFFADSANPESGVYSQWYPEC